MKNATKSLVFSADEEVGSEHDDVVEDTEAAEEPKKEQSEAEKEQQELEERDSNEPVGKRNSLSYS